MTAPLFSNTWTQRWSAPAAAVSATQRSTTPAISSGDISASVRSWRGEKQSTRHRPRTGSARRSSEASAARGRDRRARQQRAEVVVERERAFVGGVDRALRALIAGAEIAGRIVGRPRLARGRLGLALPRALRAVGRHQHPLIGQRIIAAVRVIFGIEAHTESTVAIRCAPRPGRDTNVVTARPCRRRYSRASVSVIGAIALTAHQHHRATAEAAAGHARAEDAARLADLAGDLDQRVELGAAHLEVVAQRPVALVHERAEPGELAVRQRGGGGDGARVLGDDVARAAVDLGAEGVLRRLDRFERRVAQRRNARGGAPPPRSRRGGARTRRRAARGARCCCRSARSPRGRAAAPGALPRLRSRPAAAQTHHPGPRSAGP